MYWKDGIYFGRSMHLASTLNRDEEVECAVIFDPDQKALKVYTSKSKVAVRFRKKCVRPL